MSLDLKKKCEHKLKASTELHPLAHLCVKVQDEQLGLLRPVPGAHGAHQLGGARPYPPHHAAGTAGVEGDQVSDELS